MFPILSELLEFPGSVAPFFRLDPFDPFDALGHLEHFVPDHAISDLPAALVKQMRKLVRLDAQRPGGDLTMKTELLVDDWVQWVDLREHLQETIDFPMKIMGFSCNFSLKPIN